MGASTVVAKRASPFLAFSRLALGDTLQCHDRFTLPFRRVSSGLSMLRRVIFP
jgi:hypothetical protein